MQQPPSQILINNAGLVILQSFIVPLFSRLGLCDNKEFIDEGIHRRAVHCLQYLVAGKTVVNEQELMLNKLLCGRAIDEPVGVEIELSAAEQEVCNKLLASAIAYWPAIGATSLDGFRGNWLMRNGSLHESPDRWDLIIERRPYDILLASSPFTYSVIKLPWMEKPLYVTWPA